MSLNQGKLCFVVDDDVFSRRALRNILHKMGYDTMEAEDGKEAFAMLEGHSPEVIFLDWDMPVMDGLEFLKKANSVDNRESFKVIFLTAEVNSERILEAMEENPDEYITKPFSKNKIESVLYSVGAIN